MRNPGTNQQHQHRTLVEILAARGSEQAGSVAYRWLEHRDFQSEQVLTYGELDRHARAVAAMLAAEPDPRPVILFFPPGLAYIIAFFGCLYAGRIAVPLYPPRPNRKLARVSSAVLDCGAGLALTTEALLPALEIVKAETPELVSLALVTVDATAEAPAWQGPQIQPHQIAFLQYTSGSTGDPKGVMVTHANLLANQRAITRGFDTRADDHCLSWLPLYHDMGLIGCVLHPLYRGIPATLMSPISFVQDPLFWLEALTHYRATLAGAPNFAYDLCVERAVPERLAALDLSHWQVAFNGAEPVRAKTIQRFTETFQEVGFQGRSFFPCYGMAEATLFISGGGRGAYTHSHRFDYDDLQQGRVSPAQAGESLELVGCGAALAEHEVAVIDPKSGQRLEAGRIGELWFAGPSVAAGYWQRPSLTRACFGANLDDDTRYLRTGDLGFLYQGALYITGRLKDVIIIRGRNYFPSDIESAMEACHEAAKRGGSAAFSVTLEGVEHLVVVQEVERRFVRNLDTEALVRAIRDTVSGTLAIQVHTVALVKPGGILKTSSGKVRRDACRQAFLDHSLPLLEQQAPQQSITPAVTTESLSLEAALCAWLADQLGQTRGAIDAQTPLTALGLDSIGAIKLQHRLERHHRLQTPLEAMLSGASLAELLAQALSVGPPEADACPPGNEAFPLSHNQQALWYLEQLQDHGGAYHLAYAFRTGTQFRPDRLKAAFEQLVMAHPMLRSRFTAHQGELRQQPMADFEPPIEAWDARAWSDSALKAFLAEESGRRFELERSPPFRLSLLRRDDSYLLLFVGHHIAFDFWSFGLLWDQLNRLYTGTLPVLPVGSSYAHFQRDQLRLLGEAEGVRQRDYWARRLAEPRAVLELPLDQPRPARRGFNGDRAFSRIPAQSAARLQKLANTHQTTLFNTVFALYAAMLHRYSGQSDLLVGTPGHGRGLATANDIVGYCVNPLAIRLDFSARPSVGGFLDQLKHSVLEAMAHGDYPFGLLVDHLKPARDPARSPLFDTLFVWHSGQAGLPAVALRQPGATLMLGDCPLESIDEGLRAAQFDLSLHAALVDGEILLSLEYDRDLFWPRSAARMLDALAVLAAHFTDAEPVSQLPVETPEERHRVLIALNALSDCVPPELLDLLDHDRTPADTVVLHDADGPWTQSQLQGSANGIARALAQRGIGPGHSVGICMPRRAAMVAAMLGVIKSGATYLPLDPGYPRLRLQTIALDASPSCILVTPQTAELLAEVPLPLHDLSAAHSAHKLQVTTSAQQLSHIIYTSGSTGRPKGVAITRANTAALLRWAARAFPEGCMRGMLASTAICFDLSVFELFLPLCSGGRIVLVENLLTLAEPSCPPDITLINTVPSAMQELLRLAALPASTQVVCLAGEALPAALVRDLEAARPDLAIYNLYGPSEDTTYSTFTRVHGDNTPSIGRPIDGSAVYLLDDQLQPVPYRALGELYLSGAGLARGYHQQPGRTAAAFVPNPFAAQEGGERLYRTGDLARCDENGDLLFAGRADAQVKVRGFRIEIEEIEKTLERFTGVARAIVCLVSQPVPSLVAYYTTRQELDPHQLRAFIAERLPHYMVPASFLSLPRFPMTANGKIDRRALMALPRPDLDRPSCPLSDSESRLAELWSELLGTRPQTPDAHFFELGGHSLLATRLVALVAARLGRTLSLSQVLSLPTLGAQAAAIDACDLDQASVIPRLDLQADADQPLSFAQRRLWVLDGMEGANVAYLMPATFRISGPLDCQRLEAALAGVLRVHEVLRSIVVTQEGLPRQRLTRPHWHLQLVDLNQLAPERQSTAAAALSLAAARRPMSLETGPLYRFLLVRLHARQHELVAVFHHIVADGWSIRIIFDQLARCYAAPSRAYPEPTLRYRDYAAWEQQRPPASREALRFWEAQLEGAPEQTTLPTDHPRPALQSFSGSQYSFPLSARQVARLNQLCRQQGATPHMGFFAVFALLLAHYNQREDLVIGVPVANRHTRELAEVVGFFVNTLPIRLRVSPFLTVAELLTATRNTLMAAYDHQEVPFNLLVDQLKPQRDASHGAFFQCLFLLEEEEPSFTLEGLAITPLERHSGTAKCDLTLALQRQGEGYLARVEYPTALFTQAKVSRLGEHFRQLVAMLPQAGTTPVAALSPLTARERALLLEHWSQAGVWHDSEPAVRRFEALARRVPQQVAVTAAEQSLTYGDLNSWANRLARGLRERGIDPGQVVGLCLSRDAFLIGAVLAIHKAGATYLPLDPHYPHERLAFMVEDAGASMLLCDRHTRAAIQASAEQIWEVATTLGDDDPGELGLPVLPNQRAHLIYTSGSTGRPKGVVVQHRSVSQLIDWALATYAPTELAKVLFATSVCFDLSVFEMMVPLCAGGEVMVARDVFDLVHTDLAARVTLINTVPSAMEELLAARLEAPALRVVNLAGEALSGILADRLQRHFRDRNLRLFNLYGPSEDTTYSTAALIAPGETNPAIGKPLPGTRVYVLDAWLRPVATGIPGRLYLSGSGLAEGYVKRAAQTAAVFVPNPFHGSGERLYHTGDLACFLEHGDLRYLGRIDHQVKLRGFRIELGEIEDHLLRHERVDAAVVLLRAPSGGPRRLIAYVVPRPGAFDPEALIDTLKGMLPGYMVPSALMVLDELPRTPNGKIDRKSLPEPRWAPATAEPPATLIERELAELWAKVLGVSASRQDDFFTLGGDSLSAMRVLGMVRDRFRVSISLARFFRQPSLAGLAECIETAERAAEPAPRSEEVGARRPLAPAQEAMWLLDHLQPEARCMYLITAYLDLDGPLCLRALASAVDLLGLRHENLHSAFVLEGEALYQYVAAGGGPRLAVIEAPPQWFDQLSAKAAQKPFDLTHAPLVRVVVLRGGPLRHRLLLTIHHLISDGWSLGLLTHELLAAYRGALAGQDATEPARLQYKDYVAWYARWCQTRAHRDGLAFWREHLDGAPPLLTLPTETHRPVTIDPAGGSLPLLLDSALLADLRDLGASQELTLFMVLQTAFAILLRRYANQDEVVVGTATAGRFHPSLEALIGLFVNTLALRFDLSGDPNLATAMARVKATCLAANAHERVPFEHVVDHLKIDRATSHHPLFQAMLVLQNVPREAVEIPGLTVGMGAPPTRWSKVDLSLNLHPRGDELHGELVYRRDLFAHETVVRFAGHFMNLLNNLSTSTALPLSRLPLLLPEERQRMLEDWNRTQPASRGDVMQWLRDWAMRAPESPALVDAPDTGPATVLSYGQLVARAHNLAHVLAARGLGVERGAVLAMERGANMVIAMVAVLHVGGYYIPLDMNLPARRLRDLVSEAEPTLILCDGPPPEALADLAVLDLASLELDRPCEPWTLVAVHADQAAYQIFTSGSTGRPKGVLVSRGALSNYTSGVSRTMAFQAGWQVALASTLAADLGLTAVYPTLTHGGCLHVLSARLVTHSDQFAAYIRHNAIDCMKIVPSHLAALRAEVSGSEGLPRALLVLGGEAADPRLTNEIFRQAPALKILNHYGPTETTVGVLTHPMGGPSDRIMPLGRPLPGMRAHLLDFALEPVPQGVTGEIHLGGPALARGYRGLAALTASGFIPDPFSAVPGQRLYKTGDLGHYDGEGRITFLGRRDHQTKIRGFRVELREIEHALRAIPGIDEALVVQDAQARLIAYGVGVKADPIEVRRALALALPSYMVPDHFLVLGRMPLTANGKVDRGALPVPDAAAPAQDEPLKGAVQRRLAEIWAELLGRESIGAHDHFFLLGGHSLLAIRLISRIRQAFACELQLASVFAAPTLRELAAHIERADQGYVPLLPRGHQDPIEPAFAQQRLWFLDRFETHPGLYNLPSSLRLEGRLDVASVEASLNLIIVRHEALRTVFSANRDGLPCMSVTAPRQIALTVVELGQGGDRQAADVAALLRRETARPFHLESDLMLRALVLRLDETRHQLLLTLHHLVADAWSLECLVAEFLELYHSHCQNLRPRLPELPVQYGDYALWQKQRLQGAYLTHLQDYWKGQLAGFPELLELPSDRPRPPGQTFAGGLLVHELPRQTFEAVTALGQALQSTPFMVLEAAFALLLARYSHQDDILIGSPVANRYVAELEHLIGFFLNTLVLRTRLTSSLDMRALLWQTRTTVLEAFAHQDLPLERVVGLLGPKRDLSHTPLFQVMFVYQDAPMEATCVAGVSFIPELVDRGVARFDLTLNCQRRPEGLRTFWEYNEHLFDRETIQRMANHFATLLDQMAAHPAWPVDRLPLFDDRERQQLLSRWNARAEASACPSLIELLEQACHRYADAPAVTSFEGVTLSYRQLDEAASQLAHHLVVRGLRPGDLVGVLIKRTRHLLPSLLAVLKAGAAYVPIDPDFPAERIAYMLDDANLAFLVGADELIRGYQVEHPIAVDREADWNDSLPASFPALASDSGQTAYAIYTSGSTGSPKGVPIQHATVGRLLAGLRPILALQPGQSLLALTTICFDISVLELFLPLASGAQVRLAPEGTVADPVSLVAQLEGVDLVQATPATWQMVRQSGCPLPPGLTVLCGGEALPLDLAVYLRQRVARLFNLYGPTETTVWSAVLECSDCTRHPLPIGAPLAGERLFLLDRHLEPTPVGVAGQIWIAGVGLSPGYLRRPARSAASFVPDPFSALFGDQPGARMYRTGDLGRRLPDGTIAFMGRVDHQVKLHGFRIELGEIEAVLGRHPAIAQAAVILHRFGGGDDRLFAYLVSVDDRDLDPRELRAHLAQCLPDYMIPALFTILDALPMTPNGKVDRRALPAPQAMRPRAVVEPRDEHEKLIASLWRDVLQLDQVSIHDDFFDLGGHSLLVGRLQSRLNELLNLELPLKYLFEASVLSDQAALLCRLSGAVQLQTLEEKSLGDHEEITL